mgnify:CR=1 FL=1
MDMMNGTFWLQVLQIIWINILLSGDNAVVIALACRSLPERQQRMGVMLGAGAAIAMRVAFTAVAATLMALPTVGMDGKPTASDDPRFRGKVVVVSIGGSWCPNCHDEAPFLSELYKGYHDQGLEIVAFAFEEEAQLKDPVRLRAFIRNFAITYPVVLVGQPEQLAEKVPQAENLNAFPTTLFIGRDGRIRAIHAGFASKATGEFYGKGKDEMTAIVKDLLAEPAVSRTN